MTTKPVVAGTDGSEESLLAVEWAAREAVLRGAGLRIVSVGEFLPGMHEHHEPTNVDIVTDVLRENRDQALDTAAQRAEAAAPGLLIDTDVLSGPIAQAVADSGSGAAMLVVGSRGVGAFAAMILGSVSRFVATHASCPVVVVRGESAIAEVARHVVIGIRDWQTSADAFAFAFEEAALRQGGLHIVHVQHGHASPGHGLEATLDDVLSGWQEKYPGVQVSHNVADGHPGRVLSEMSASADLVIIGRRPATTAGGHGPGRVTHALLNHALGPVGTVPSA
jgi:nucleotide-binding universal stress UspA family protein